MKRVLIVSPHFPPVDAVDMHRVRHGVNFYRDHGWQPTVLCVRPEQAGRSLVPDLLRTVPEDIEVHAVDALPLSLTQRFGVRALGLRTLRAVYAAGNALLARGGYDLVFFSTTSFPLMPLGRLWKKKHGVPYVLDIQDPWASDYAGKGKRRGAKHSLMRAINRKLEQWTVPSASGIIAVSAGYVDELRDRYEPLRSRPARAIPFGFLPLDFEVANEAPLPALLRIAGKGGLRGVYMGALDGAMDQALRVLLKGWQLGAEKYGEPFSSMKMFFVGTSYANGALAKAMVLPLASELGIRDVCYEQPERVPYFESLAGLLSADFLILPIRDSGGYVPSKLFPLLFLEKPIVAIAPAKSPLVPLLGSLPSVALGRFPDCKDDKGALGQFVEQWHRLVTKPAAISWEPQRGLLERHLAKNVAREECEIFDQAACVPI